MTSELSFEAAERFYEKMGLLAEFRAGTLTERQNWMFSCWVNGTQNPIRPTEISPEEWAEKNDPIWTGAKEEIYREMTIVSHPWHWDWPFSVTGASGVRHEFKTREEAMEFVEWASIMKDPINEYAEVFGITWANGMLEYLPLQLQGGMVRYIIHGVRPDHFLSAYLSNDLMGVLGQADDGLRHKMWGISMFLRNYAPPDCFGSEANFESWISAGGSQWKTS